MTTSMYCLYVEVDYTYIDINTLAQGIKSCLASQVCFKALLGLEPMAPICPQLLVFNDTSNTFYLRLCALEMSLMYVCLHCMYVCVHVCVCVPCYIETGF